jgi:prepilin-type N-terminal cleavage/methylation domain-containing protein
MGKMMRTRPDRNSGFTLTELMITVSIIAITLSFGVPSFDTLTLTQNARTAASDLQTSLFFARSEALKRAVDVNVVPARGDWKNGWTVELDDGSVLRSEAPLSKRLASMSGTTITYQSDGHIPPPALRTIKFYTPQNTNDRSRRQTEPRGQRLWRPFACLQLSRNGATPAAAAFRRGRT